MEKTTLLTKQLLDDSQQCAHLSGLIFESGNYFGWNHETATITLDPNDANASAYTLHEYGHAALKHSDYKKDIELLTMERDAWTFATDSASRFALDIDPELIEDSLDTYRNWLHSRSLCPKCGATGIQIDARQYDCIACHTKWTVNEARTCALRRYETKSKNSAN